MSKTPPSKTPTLPSGPVESDATERVGGADSGARRGVPPDEAPEGGDPTGTSRSGEQRPIADVDRKVRPGDA